MMFGFFGFRSSFIFSSLVSATRDKSVPFKMYLIHHRPRHTRHTASQEATIQSSRPSNPPRRYMPLTMFRLQSLSQVKGSRHTAKLASHLLASSPASIHQCRMNLHQLRFHRTDYDGPGKYDERETGSLFGSHDHSHEHGHHHDHSHSNDDAVNDKEKLRALLQSRYIRRSGTYDHRGYTVGIGGPVGSGKTALTLALCKALRGKIPMGVVTNDIFTQEDAEFLVRNKALDKGRIMPVETGGCPHAAIREDVSANLGALELLTRRINSEESDKYPLLLCESGGDNLAANFSNELADYTIYVIDVAGGDKVPRKGVSYESLHALNYLSLHFLSCSFSF